MKITKNDEKINILIKTNEDNIFISDVLNLYLKDRYAYINSVESGFFTSLIDVCGIDENSDEYDICVKHIEPFIKRLDPEIILENPYFKKIKNINVSSKNLKLEMNYYAPYEGFLYDDVTFTKDYSECNHLGYFTKKISYLNFLEDDVVWMSITPFEIISMQEAINNASGNVLVYGLGLGYFPFMCALKDSVKSITIIEKDPNIIKFINSHLVTQFVNKNKIKIVEADAYNYDSTGYNYVFIDTYRNEEDGLIPYIRLKGKEINGVQYSYWIENTFIAILRRMILTIVYENMNDIDTSIYDKAENDFDLVINAIYQQIKNITIDSYDDVKKLISNDSINKIIKKINI